MLLALSRKL